ncbi:phosphate ABC transporter substrate-binding protein PstS [uncultured Rhodoblastus sp.]|uniref:phosphate ABC transporter substrate-binding protein PstS n=1 Tax=uncultured Rhodoblastus sp. TaxID=543037 RepID=UPI0025DCB183|nr:phosphate ABC transporter substrate-binding protein PstS [uncultured Rhodoblastus sp.]
MLTRRMALRNSLLASGAALMGSTLAEYSAEADENLSLHGAGSTFSAPLYKKWIEAYQQDHKDVSLSYDVVGSGLGVSRFVHGAVDFGATDVLPGGFILSTVKRGVIAVPVTAGMIVLAYNIPGLGGVLNLPKDVYADIFTGHIKVWNDARIVQANKDLHLPNRDIAVVVRQDSSGTTAAFTRNLVAISPNWAATGAGDGFTIDWPTAAMLGKGNEGVAQKIKISEGSIGFVEYGFAKRLGLSMAILENDAGKFVSASEASGTAALLASERASVANPLVSVDDVTANPPGDASYPIVTLSYLLLYRKYADARKASALKDWVKWGLTTGQTFASGLGYIALPAETAAHAGRALDSLS